MNTVTKRSTSAREVQSQRRAELDTRDSLRGISAAWKSYLYNIGREVLCVNHVGFPKAMVRWYVTVAQLAVRHHICCDGMDVASVAAAGSTVPC